MPRLSPVTGRYVQVDADGAQYKVFFQENGDGIPLVCQHTAGCHNHQWRYLLEDPELTKSFRVIAYDLPRHGKSDPPANQEWWKEEYRLTTTHFVNFIMAFCKELELESPIFMGSSFGGCVALHLAHDHPEYFRAVIGLEAAEYRPGFYNDWFHHPHVNSQDVNSYGVMGLMAVPPLISEQDRRATVFYYSQGAPGVLKGDLYFYSVDHDMRHSVHEIDTSQCMVYMLTGEYDYLTTPKMSKETCDKIQGAQFIEMRELGHFPMSESGPAFKRYITPVLEEIRSKELASTSR